jgi:hypothetical protein
MFAAATAEQNLSPSLAAAHQSPCRRFPLFWLSGIILSPYRFVGFAVVTSQAGCIQQARSACGCCSTFDIYFTVVGVADKLPNFIRRLLYHHHTLSLLEAKFFEASSGFLWLFFQAAFIAEHRACIAFHFTVRSSFSVCCFYFPLLEKWGQCCVPTLVLTSY